jgi:hypothetical protein
VAEMGRANWYYDHPPACTCVSCVKKRQRPQQYVTDHKRPSETSKKITKQQPTTVSTTGKYTSGRKLKIPRWLWSIIPITISIIIIVYFLNNPPLTISEISIFNITEDSATITCNTNINCYCILNVKFPNQVWQTFLEGSESASTHHFFELSDLYRGKKYTFKIYANSQQPVIPQQGYFSTVSDEIYFETKVVYPVISDLEVYEKYASWSTDVPTTFTIDDYGQIIARSREYEYSKSHHVELNLSPYADHLLTVTVFDQSGISSQSAPISIEGQLAHRLIPVQSHVSPSGLVELIDNPQAVDPTYGQLVAFLEMDITDKQLYQQDFFTCGDYAEILHNNAEKTGWRAAFVVIEIHPPQETSVYTPWLFSDRQPKEDTTSDTILHACNAFQTKDLGLVFIDNTGAFEEAEYPFTHGISVFTPGRADKVVKVKIGEEYCPESIFKRSATNYKCMGIVSNYIIYWSPTEITHLP